MSKVELMTVAELAQLIKDVQAAYKEAHPDGKMSMEDFLRPKKEIKDLISSKTGEAPGEGG